MVLVAAAFVAGDSVRWVDLMPRPRAGGQALAQPQPTPAPRESPRQKEQQGNRDRGTVAGTVESVRDRILVVKVTQARGVKVDQGAMTDSVGFWKWGGIRMLKGILDLLNTLTGYIISW